MAEMLQKMNERLYGQDYKVSFTADFPRDGKPHALLWNVNGKEYPLSFTAPSFSPAIWIKEHALWSILIGIGLLLLIISAVFFICRTKKKRRREWMNIEAKHRKIQQEADVNRKDLDDFRRQKEEQERIDKEQDFLKLMQTKNLFPRLQYADNGKDITYTVHKPETSIGRNTDNDLILPSDSVSRHHAKLVLNGNGFEIRDLESTNKVIVNGRFVDTRRATYLQTGDIIGLGEIVIYFFV